MLKSLSLILLLTLLVGCGEENQSKPIVIKFSHVLAPTTPKGRAADLLKKLVEERLSGKVIVEVYPSSQLMGDDDSLEALAFNDIQMSAVSLSKYNRYTEKFQIFDLPFLFDDQAAVKVFFASPEGVSLLTILEDKGFKGLGFWPNGMKQLGANTLLRMPSDAQGLKFRIMESDVLEEQFLALGANPQKMAFKEVYHGLQTGTIDGQENTWSNMYSRKFYEVQNFISETNHGFIGYIWMVNAEFWNGLPEDIRRDLAPIIAEVNAYANKMAYDINQEARSKIYEAYPDRIVTLTPEELAQWKIAMEPVWQKFSPSIGQDLIDAALASNQHIAPAPSIKDE